MDSRKANYLATGCSERANKRSAPPNDELPRQEESTLVQQLAYSFQEFFRIIGFLNKIFGSRFE